MTVVKVLYLCVSLAEGRVVLVVFVGVMVVMIIIVECMG